MCTTSQMMSTFGLQRVPQEPLAMTNSLVSVLQSLFQVIALIGLLKGT